MNSYKKTEAMLYGYKKTMIEIKNMKLDLEVLENDYRGMSAIGYEERVKGTNAFHSSVESEVIRRDEEIFTLKNKIRLKEIEIQKIDNVLELLEERDSYLIKEYYINDNQLKNISRHVNLEESYLSTYKSKLIKRISNILHAKE